MRRSALGRRMDRTCSLPQPVQARLLWPSVALRSFLHVLKCLLASARQRTSPSTPLDGASANE